ncbi:MAG: YdeI/OmpD-associated family protein [Imperialibacter sp.]
MTKPQKFTFEAIIQKHGNIDAAYVEFPYSTEEVFAKKGQVKIVAVFDGRVTYRGSLANMGLGFHMLGLTKAVRNDLGKSFGDKVAVELQEDTAPRVVEVPADATRLLTDNPKAAAFYEKLSYTDKKEYIRWIDSAKREETRQNRLAVFIEKLSVGKKLVDK